MVTDEDGQVCVVANPPIDDAFNPAGIHPFVLSPSPEYTLEVC